MVGKYFIIRGYRHSPQEEILSGSYIPRALPSLQRRHSTSHKSRDSSQPMTDRLRRQDKHQDDGKQAVWQVIVAWLTADLDNVTYNHHTSFTTANKLLSLHTIVSRSSGALTGPSLLTTTRNYSYQSLVDRSINQSNQLLCEGRVVATIAPPVYTLKSKGTQHYNCLKTVAYRTQAK